VGVQFSIQQINKAKLLAIFDIHIKHKSQQEWRQGVAFDTLLGKADTQSGQSI